MVEKVEAERERFVRIRMSWPAVGRFVDVVVEHVDEPVEECLVDAVVEDVDGPLGSPFDEVVEDVGEPIEGQCF